MEVREAVVQGLMRPRGDSASELISDLKKAAGSCAAQAPPPDHLVAMDGVSPPGEAPILMLHGEEQRSLSDAFVRDTLEALPLKPVRVTDVEGPYLEITHVHGDETAVDVEVRHHFRAHFDPAQAPLVLPPSPRVRCVTPHIVELGSEDGGSAVASPVATLFPATSADAAAALAAAVGDPSGVKEPPFAQDLALICPWDSTAAAAAAAEAAANPRILSPFEVDPAKVSIGSRVAVGGFAEVFLGKYQGTLVAVKLLQNVDAAARERFAREVTLMASLRHPNLLLFMGYTSTPHLAIISEFMHRGSLFKVLRKGGSAPLEPRLQRAVAVSVARGMANLHSRSPPLLHMDLKSPNILIDDRWRVKIADFGLSRVRQSTFLSGAGAGTPEWMAPETLRSEAHNEKADVYSYGVVLWEILTGQVPWEGMHPMQVVGSVGFQGRSLDLPTGADPFLTDLCRRCISPLPADRPSFPQIVQELEERFDPAHLRGDSMQSTLSAAPVRELEASDAGPAAVAPRALPSPPFPPHSYSSGGDAAALPLQPGSCAAQPRPGHFAAAESALTAGMSVHQVGSGSGSATNGAAVSGGVEDLTLVSPFARLAPFPAPLSTSAGAASAALLNSGSGGGGACSQQQQLHSDFLPVPVPMLSKQSRAPAAAGGAFPGTQQRPAM